MIRIVAIVGGVMALSAGCSQQQKPAPSSTDLRATSCLGPTDATSFAVYLHGMDAPTVSEQEIGNRANLARVAKALSMRIALARSTLPCPTQPSSACWGWTFDDRETRAAVTTIKAAAEACFGQRSFGLIGFSNGGYLLSNMFRTCRLREELPDASWVVTVGSAAVKGALEPEPERLQGCGRMVILTGTSDTYNFDPMDHFLHALQEKGADVKGRRFDGGHAVPDSPLRSVLEQLQPPQF